MCSSENWLTGWARLTLGGHVTEVRVLLDWLEDQYLSGNNELRDLIVLGFVEGMNSTDDALSEVRTMLGQELRREYDGYRLGSND